MTRFLRGTLLLLAAIAVGGLLDWGPAGGFTGTVQAKPPGPKGKGTKGLKGKEDLQKAYDALSDVSVRMDAGRGRPARDLTRLFERAKDLYGEAVRAARADDDVRARELATAAHDAARGLVHALRADAPATAGLPAPPRRDEYELDDLLRRTRDRLEDAVGLAPRGPGASFSTPHAGSTIRRAGTDATIRLARCNSPAPPRRGRMWANISTVPTNGPMRVRNRSAAAPAAATETHLLLYPATASESHR